MSKIMCSNNCGKEATHETITDGEYVCEAGNCILALALDGYIDGKLTEEDHQEE